MANSTNVLTDNFTTKLAKVFLEKFEASRVVTKTVNTQLLEGKFNPASGTTTDFKRPHDYVTARTATGDISAVAKSDIISAKATGTVQDYFTVHIDWDEVDEALKLDQLDEILAPAADRMVTDLETDFAAFMMVNAGLLAGTPGAAIATWKEVADSGALMDSVGVPNMGRRYYVMNPFASATLSNVQLALASGAPALVTTAWQNAQISRPLAGLQGIASNALGSFNSGAITDFAGLTNGIPDQTYATNKDTMTMQLPVDGFGAGSDVIVAGSVVTIATINRLSSSTRNTFLDGSAANVLWSGVVTTDLTLSSGGGTLTVSNAPIFDTGNGQYNNVDSAIADGLVVTIVGGVTATVYQPNLFYHQQAFGIGFVPLKKLFSTDTLVTTRDGIRIRISKYSDGEANKQRIRFDMLPAYAVFNPLFAGQGFGA